MHDLIVVVRYGPELIKKIVQMAVKLDGRPVDFNHFQFLAEQSRDDKSGLRACSFGFLNHFQEKVLLFEVEFEIVAVNLVVGHFRSPGFSCSHKLFF